MKYRGVSEAPVDRSVMRMPNIFMVTQLWGRSYIDLYADVVIPTLLAPGNLPSLAPTPCVYTIYTTVSDQETLEQHPNFARLKAAISPWCQVVFSLISRDVDNSYETMSACHRDAIEQAERLGAAILFLQPDVIVGPGTLETVRRVMEGGRRVVLAPGLRACREEVMAALSPPGETAGRATPTTRHLVGLALRNLHPISLSLIWGGEVVSSYCSHLYWPISHEVLYARCAHMHPLMVWPEVKGARFDHTIDWDYFYRACPDQDRWFVAATSDEICLIELSDREKFADALMRVTATPQSVAWFLSQATKPPHLALFRRHYVFLAREMKDEELAEPHAEAEALIEEALRLNGRRWIIRLVSTPVTVLTPFAQLMSRTSDRLARVKRRHPVLGGIAYWSYRGVFVSLRPLYRMLIRLQR